MKKIFKTISVMMMSLPMCLGGVGCIDNGEIPQTANDIALKYWSSGLGDAGITAVVNAYNAKQTIYKVWLDSYTASNSGVSFGSSDIDTNDL